MEISYNDSTEPEKRKRIAVGKFFKYSFGYATQETYILAVVEAKEESKYMMSLISIEDGNRFMDPVNVKDCDDVSAKEWEKISTSEMPRDDMWSHITDIKINIDKTVNIGE